MPAAGIMPDAGFGSDVSVAEDFAAGQVGPLLGGVLGGAAVL